MLKYSSFITSGLSAVLLASMLITSCGNTTEQRQSAGTAEKKARPVSDGRKTIVFFGNSLTAGYGLEDLSEAFPSVIGQKIDSLNLPYRVINAGLSGETTAGGKSRIKWIMKQPIDVFVLELGANDGLRGIPVTETQQNLQSIIMQVKERYPKVKIVLLGMEVPPNMGPDYTGDFRAVFRRVAEANKLAFVPFMLDGVAGDPKLNQGDGIHPTGEGYKIVAENVWKVLKKEL
jgi:acyl-CoA thioesterase I